MFRKATSQANAHTYVEERLSDYIDGQLPDAERAEVRKHLQTCPQCQASLDSLGWTVKLLKQVPAPPLPRQFTLPVPESRPAPAPWLKWGLATASVLAALVLVSVVSLNYLSQQPAPTQFAVPAAAPPQHTLVAAVPPTSAPPIQDRSAAPTTLPAAQAPEVVPAATSAPLPTVAPTSIVLSAQSLPKASPTQERAPQVAKSAPATLECQACGGGGAFGLGGGAPETATPIIRMMTAPTAITDTGIVKDRAPAVRDSPSDKGNQIGSLTRGTQVQVLERDPTDSWLQIVFPIENIQGLTGWVAVGSITLSVPLENVPTEVPPTETPASPSGMSNDEPPASATAVETLEEATVAVSATSETAPSETSTPVPASASTNEAVTPVATPAQTTSETPPA